MEYVKIRSLEEYLKYIKQNSAERISLEKRLEEEFKKNKIDFIFGYCRVCEQASRLKIKIKKNNKIVFRDSLVCEFCKLNSRKRFMLSYLKDLTKHSNSIPTVFMYEQITKFFKFSSKIKNIKIIGSEFLGYDKKPGQNINNIRHEDAMNLSLDNNSTDIVVSNDVYEHVPFISKALDESFRVLKNSGTLLISIPFHINNTKTISRATLGGHKVEHILPPIYHSNPVAENEGSLVYYDYGWDFLDMLRKAGFSDAYMLGFYDILFGHIGNGLQFIFCGVK